MRKWREEIKRQSKHTMDRCNTHSTSVFIVRVAQHEHNANCSPTWTFIVKRLWFIALEHISFHCVCIRFLINTEDGAQLVSSTALIDIRPYASTHTYILKHWTAHQISFACNYNANDKTHAIDCSFSFFWKMQTRPSICTTKDDQTRRKSIENTHGLPINNDYYTQQNKNK